MRDDAADPLSLMHEMEKEMQADMMPMPMPMPMPMVMPTPMIAPNVEAAIEQAIDEMDRMPPGGPMPMGMASIPVLELQEADMVTEKTLKNGHEVREEVIETPDHKVIKVTEEGPDARDRGNVKEVKDELTKQFENMQSSLKPGPGEAMRIHEETGTDGMGRVQGTITVDKVHVNKDDLIELKKMNPDANIFDHKQKQDLARLDQVLDDEVKPVNGNKLFGKGGLKAPIQIGDADDSATAGNDQPGLAPHVPGEQTPIARYGMFLVSMGLLLMVILVWFVLSCRNNGKGGRHRDYHHPNSASSEMQGYKDFSGAGSDDDDDDDESFAHKKR